MDGQEHDKNIDIARTRTETETEQESKNEWLDKNITRTLT